MSTNRPDRTPSHTVVVGLGSPLMGDDGLGLAALARLQEQWTLPLDVELVDGGTWGMTLLPTIEDAGRLLLIDAIDIAAVPGSHVALAREDLPRYFATRISPHQVDLRDVLAVAELRGRLPAHTTAIGLQPAWVQMSTDLSDVVTHRLDELVERVVRMLQTWGHRCVPKRVGAKT